MSTSRILDVLREQEGPLLEEWLTAAQSSVELRRSELMKDAELRRQSAEFLALLRDAASKGDLDEVRGDAWGEVRDCLNRLARSRSTQGFTPTETALFVLALKRPLFRRLRAVHTNADALADDCWNATLLLDKLALLTTEHHQHGRDEVIRRQQEEMLELSTPVVRLWDGVLALPLIGTLDSARTQTAMESLLQRIVETESEIAIIDITGVPTVDTLVAQHLLKTVAAARLMGADCMISGIRPQIAQTMVHLAIDLSDVTTKATLADAFAAALERIGGELPARRHNGAAAPAPANNGRTAPEPRPRG